MSKPDLDFIHDGLISALRAIRAGANLSGRISVPPVGQTSTVGTMLVLASRHLDEPFHEEQMLTVRGALAAVGLTGPTSNKRQVALKLLEYFTQAPQPKLERPLTAPVQ